MELSRETLEALKIMGLTDYETRTYMALNSLITADAAEISAASNVPRSKVYQILKSLVKKGFIEMDRGKPLKFTVISPHEIFLNYRKRIKTYLDTAEAEVNHIYESQIPEFPAPIWLVHGPDKIVSKEMEIISRAEESLFMIGGLMFPEELPALKKNLERSMEKGININMLTAPTCVVDNKEISTRKALENLPLEIKFFPVPYIKLLVRDKKEMLIAFCKLSGNSAMSESAIAIWNQYQEFVDVISGVYEFIWKADFFNQAFPPAELQKKEL